MTTASQIQNIISKHVLPASGLPEQPPLGAIEEAAREIAALFESGPAEPRDAMGRTLNEALFGKPPEGDFA